MHISILYLSIIFLLNYKLIIHYASKFFKHHLLIEFWWFSLVPIAATFLFFNDQYHADVFFNVSSKFYFYIIAFLVGIAIFALQYFLSKIISLSFFNSNKITLVFNKGEIPNLLLLSISEEIVYRYIIHNCFFILVGYDGVWSIFLTTIFFAINNFWFSKKSILDFVFKLILGAVLGVFSFFLNVIMAVIVHLVFNLCFILFGFMQTKKYQGIDCNVN
ncbi:unnamed protein product [Mycoplasma amphoriforme A39]|uniref:CPBP family intramembrane metalloprotease n=1 Tax=Mycoplasma amphoriforme A39 TaxID=572419 RepID=A0A292II42_9MOLU|nr:unnamed protein product [Mycoplasma amphoriforme A39]